MITDALSALKTKLATVATTYSDRAALETTSATLPVITMVSLGDALAGDQDYTPDLYTRRLVIEYKCTAATSYQSTLDTALVAIRALLVQSSGAWLSGYAVDVRETGVTFFHPTDNSREAVFQLNLEIDWNA